MEIGSDALPFLSAAIKNDDYPVREVLIYHRITRRIGISEARLMNGLLPRLDELWMDRMRIIEDTAEHRVVKQAWDRLAAARAITTKPKGLSADEKAEVQRLIEVAVSEEVNSHAPMGLLLGGYALAGPRGGRPPHPLLRYGTAVRPILIAALRDDVRRERWLKYVLIVNALDNRVTTIEAALMTGCQPDPWQIAQQVARLTYGVPDVREPVGTRKR